MEIYWLEWDEDNEEHLGKHNVSPDEVREILSNRFLTMPNPEAANRIFLIGETNGGRILQVSLEETRDPTSWRPVTGFAAPEPMVKLFRNAVR